MLFQNAIRHELQDLYSMLRSAALHIDFLRASDADALQQWVAEFGQLVAMYFLVQERVIYPILAQRAERGVGLSVQRVKERNKGLVAMLLEVHRESLNLARCCRSRERQRVINFDYGCVYDALGKMSEMVSRFVESTEEMFEWEMNVAGRIVEKKMEREEARELERKCVAEVVSYEVGEKVWGSISQWLPRELKGRYMEGVDGLKVGRLRRKGRKWLRSHRSLDMSFGRNVM